MFINDIILIVSHTWKEVNQVMKKILLIVFLLMSFSVISEESKKRQAFEPLEFEESECRVTDTIMNLLTGKWDKVKNVIKICKGG